MANNYFGWSSNPSRLIPFDTARAEDLNSMGDQIESGFDGVQTKTNAAIRLPDGETAATIPVSGLRKGKVITFNKDTGAVEVNQEIGEYKGDWVTATAYKPRDIVKNATNANIYICLTAHTSGTLSTDISAARWALIVDAAAATTAANTATTQAGIATTKASEASASASTATTQATTATTKANEASASATTASTQAGIATTKANEASASATTATTKASEASVSATSAANSASAASTSATNAQTSATNAANSASSASTSATNAANSASAAAASYDAFDDRYLGAKASDPTVDNDGNALLTGALYWNSVSSEMRVYSGTAWAAAYLPVGNYVTGVASSVDNEIALFSGTGGKTIKRATTTGLLKATSGVLSAAVAGTDYVTPTGTETLSNKTLTGLKETRVAMAANNIDLSLGNYFTKTFSAGAVSLTVSNVPAAGTVACFILDATNAGTATITWMSGAKWAGGTAPTLTSAGRDVIGGFTHDGGTTWDLFVLARDIK